MSSFVDSSHNVVNIESSVTRAASCNVREGSASSYSSGGPSYDWVDPSVLKIPTKLRDFDSLDQFLSKNSFIRPDCPTNAMMAGICGLTDRVCHGRETQDFFFVYNTFFVDLHISLPFNDFTMGVLRILKVASTQLYPNSWVALQAFRVLCDLFKLIPTPQAFLYYYNTRPSTPVSWLSLSSRPGNVWFAPYTTSYKKFKEKYFKIFVEPNGSDFFYDAEGRTKFPFHWTENMTQLSNWLQSSMSPLDKSILVVFDQLPYKLLIRELIVLHGSSKKWADINGSLISCI